MGVASAIVLAQPGGPVIYYLFKPRAARGPVMKNTRAMKHTSDETHARAVKSHQPSGLAWFRVVLTYISFHPFFFSILRLSNLWGEICTSSYPLPRALGSWCPGLLLPLVATFLPSGRSPFFHCFPMPVLIDLGSILTPNLPPQIHQNPLKIHFLTAITGFTTTHGYS